MTPAWEKSFLLRHGTQEQDIHHYTMLKFVRIPDYVKSVFPLHFQRIEKVVCYKKKSLETNTKQHASILKHN